MDYTDDEQRLYNIHKTVEVITWTYVFATMFVFGLVGNALTIVVLRRGSFNQSSAVVYLLALSLLDSAALVAALLSSYLAAAWKFNLLDMSPGWCKLFKFLFPFFSNAGFWVLVAFTVDRYIAVCFPLRKIVLCRPRRAIVVCVVLLLVSAAKSAQIFWTFGFRYGYDATLKLHFHWCTSFKRYEHFELYIRPYLSMPIVLLIPFVAILTCNILIIRKLRQRNRLLQQTNADRKLTQTTAMCLSISFAFFVCATPIFCTIIAYPYTHRPGIDTSSEMKNRIAGDLSALFVYLHHAINFYLYCLTGQQFRNDLKAVLCGPCRRGGVHLKGLRSWVRTRTSRVTPESSLSTDQRAAVSPQTSNESVTSGGQSVVKDAEEKKPQGSEWSVVTRL